MNHFCLFLFKRRKLLPDVPTDFSPKALMRLVHVLYPKSARGLCDVVTTTGAQTDLTQKKDAEESSTTVVRGAVGNFSVLPFLLWFLYSSPFNNVVFN